MRLTRRGRAVVTGTVTGLAVTSLWAVASVTGGSSGKPDTGRLRVADPLPTVTASPFSLSPSASPSPRAVRRTPSPTPTATHRVTHSPTPRAQSSRHLVVVAGTGKLVGHGPLREYKVEVESGIGVSGSSFAAAVERTLGADKDWGSDYSFRRVSSGSVAFTVTLASASTTDSLCRPLDTGGSLSCYNGGRAVINVDRWKSGADTYSGHLSDYRTYVVSHEVGHALGHNHEYSCRSDGLAPVMMQQTKSLYGCKLNPWPHPTR
jgi:uncharacterized protein DUF3152